MPWIMQMLGFALMLLGIAFAIWVSFWVLLIIFLLGISVVAWAHLREFLVRKGILNPRFESTADANDASNHAAASLTIEGDYKRVDSE